LHYDKGFGTGTSEWDSSVPDHFLAELEMKADGLLDVLDRLVVRLAPTTPSLARERSSTRNGNHYIPALDSRTRREFMQQQEPTEGTSGQSVYDRPQRPLHGILSAIALILAVSSLILSTFLVNAVLSSEDTGSPSDGSGDNGTADEISQLQQEVDDLETEITTLKQRILLLEMGGGGGDDEPFFVMEARPTGKGYEFEVQPPSRVETLDSYEVTFLKNQTPWPGFPKVIAHGAIGTGPTGEYLNYTDITYDGKLTGGDFFTLENPSSWTEYKIIVVWAATGNAVASKTINTP
jgi:hypothetical protein